MKKLLALALAALLALSAAACGGSESPSSAAGSSSAASEAETQTETTVLKVAASPAPHAEILEAVKEALAAEGITLEIVEYTDYIMPNTAVDAGEMDANYFQHQPYLTNFNAENGTELVSAASIHYEPLGIYPGKLSSLEELGEGATIVVPNDPTNEGRALNLLAANGIITLSEDAGLEATVNDIVENPLNVEITEVEAAQVPMALPDYDFGVINGNYAVAAGLSDTVLTAEDPDSEAAQTYANIVAVQPDRVDDPAVQALVAALTSEEARTFITETYGGAVLPVF